MNIEYIHNQKAYRIWISNIFVSSNLTEYEYHIYLFPSTNPNRNSEYICSWQLGRIRILNKYKVNFEGLRPTIKQIFNKFCFIFIQTWGVSAAWWLGYTKKNTFVERFHQIGISHIFEPRKLNVCIWIYIIFGGFYSNIRNSNNRINSCYTGNCLGVCVRIRLT